MHRLQISWERDWRAALWSQDRFQSYRPVKLTSHRSKTQQILDKTLRYLQSRVQKTQIILGRVQAPQSHLPTCITSWSKRWAIKNSHNSVVQIKLIVHRQWADKVRIARMINEVVYARKSQPTKTVSYLKRLYIHKNLYSVKHTGLASSHYLVINQKY